MARAGHEHYLFSDSLLEEPVGVHSLGKRHPQEEPALGSSGRLRDTPFRQAEVLSVAPFEARRLRRSFPSNLPGLSEGGLPQRISSPPAVEETKGITCSSAFNSNPTLRDGSAFRRALLVEGSGQRLSPQSTREIAPVGSENYRAPITAAGFALSPHPHDRPCAARSRSCPPGGER